MAKEVKAKVALPIGLDMAYIAELLTDTTTTTYATPEYLARAIKAVIKPILKEGTLDSDDEVEIDESMIIGYTVSIDVSQLDDETRAKLLGHKIDADGGLIVSKDDKAPIVAFLFRSLLSDRKNYKYVALYKGSFKENEETYETGKKDGISYQQEGTLEGNFYNRSSDGCSKYSIRSDNPKASATKIAAWFTSVQKPADLKPPAPTV
ncbi:MAG: phage tail protein [Oscillospiraceae bacterium]